MRTRASQGIFGQPPRSPLCRRRPECTFLGANLKDAIDKTTAKWMGWTIGRNTARETGIPRGMAYLTGFVVQAAIDDEIYV